MLANVLSGVVCSSDNRIQHHSSNLKHEKHLHAALQIGDSRLFLVDESPGMGCQGPEVMARSPVTIHLFLPDVDATFNAALAAGARQEMPPTDMFWGIDTGD